ncbi:MAG TPA: hypothetical protein VLU46_14660 [Thermoanaerobaculia bacterium]|nr:hypothetical protein [Thermoanaerobaculia bacterium]
MRIIRDRADARWLPSRFNFALFRLFAYLRLRASRPQPQRGLILSVDRYQSSAENNIVCTVMVFVVASFFHSMLVGIPAAILALQAAAELWRPIVRLFAGPAGSTVEAGSNLILAAIIGGALYFARTDLVSLVFLGAVALNVIAAAIMFTLRGRVAELERSFE